VAGYPSTYLLNTHVSSFAVADATCQQYGGRLVSYDR
jgi:hypothetical protein